MKDNQIPTDGIGINDKEQAKLKRDSLSMSVLGVWDIASLQVKNKFGKSEDPKITAAKKQAYAIVNKYGSAPFLLALNISALDMKGQLDEFIQLSKDAGGTVHNDMENPATQACLAELKQFQTEYGFSTEDCIGFGILASQQFSKSKPDDNNEPKNELP